MSDTHDPCGEDHATVEDHSQQPAPEASAEETTEEKSEEATEICETVDEQTMHEEAKSEENTCDAEEATEEAAAVEEAAPEEEEQPKKLTLDDIKTAPMDFRFPTTNQTKHCFTRYVEYHKCVRDKGEDSPDCEKYARYYRALCPGEWIERWNEQRENGTFPGPL